MSSFPIGMVAISRPTPGDRALRPILQWYEIDVGILKYHLQESVLSHKRQADILHLSLCPSAEASALNRAAEANDILQDLDMIFVTE